MIIEWKLKDQKFCDGCCCFDGYSRCGFFEIHNRDVNKKGKTKRPYKCLGKNSV